MQLAWTAFCCSLTKQLATSEMSHMFAEFQYPASWLVDQRLFRRAAEQAERLRPLDPPSLRCVPCEAEAPRHHGKFACSL